MNKKQVIVATLVGSISMLLLAGAWHELIMQNFYTTQTNATHEGTGIIFVAYLILGAMMALIYPIINRGKIFAVEGLKFGVVIGILWVFPHELAMAGAHGESIAYVFLNATWHMVEQGVGGVVIAFIYRDKRKQV